MEVSFSMLLIGLQGAGKTTLLRSMANKQQEIFPTAGFEIVYVSSNSGPVLVYDCSGEGFNRKNWSILLSNCEAVGFMIDSSDPNRFSIAKDTLNRFIDRNRSLKKKPMCIMLNKSDFKDRVPRQTLYKALDIDKVQKCVGKLYVKETSGFTKDGIDECFDWLGKNITYDEAGKE